MKGLIGGAWLVAAACAGMARADAPPPQDQAPAPAQAPAPSQAPAPPTTTGRILGRLTDAGKPVQGAQVRLLSRSEAGLLRVTSSDQRGEYRFKDLPSGIYDVEVEADGYRLVSKPGVEVKGPFQNIVDVPLARAGGQQTAAAPPVQGTPGQGIPGKPEAEAARVEPPVTVRGSLLNGNRRPVVDVSVLLVALQGTKLYQAISGSDGVFTLDGVVPGRYRAVIRSPGHMPVDLKSVEVKPGAGLTLNLSLVDFPLNFKSRADGPPPELPRPMPGMLPAPASTPVPSSTSSAPPPAPPPTATEPIEKRPPAQNPPAAPPPGSAPAKPGGTS
ncbi:MAG TPA: carboxypeptidase-like regulatory domain-containing protein [Candidatus Polarisedimenticolia bacterium]|nr:carboxypeptidase-like regulatory domain-containing protein [Candidatus Polarisedimenticolia bacterium]